MLMRTGASDQNRTGGLVLTKDALYKLSYGGEIGADDRSFTCNVLLGRQVL
jgi:hypothetical protein